MWQNGTIFVSDLRTRPCGARHDSHSIPSPMHTRLARAHALARKTTRCLLLLAWCLLWSPALCTAQKKLLRKADAWYQAQQYAEAARLYEQYLAENESLAVRTRLATCYRMTNRYDRAAQLYEQIVQHARARPLSYLHYAETLMYQARYDEARIWAQRFLQHRPEDERARLLLQACDAVAHIQPLFPHMQVRPFAWNTPADELSPVFFDGGIVFTSDRNPGMRLLKEKTGWTGRDYLQLWFAPALNDTTFSTARPYDARLNELNHHCGMASFTADSTEVFFTRTSPIPSKNGAHHLQLYHAERSRNGRWKQPQRLPFCSPEYNYMHPAISPDGKQLFFTSDKSRGAGGTDIWMSTRTNKGWSRPRKLETINTAAHEAFPFMARDGRLFFCSKGHPGFGGFDIFVTQRDEQGRWLRPRNLGPPVNSPYDDITFFLAPDGTRGAFTSARNGSDDIFLFWMEK